MKLPMLILAATAVALAGALAGPPVKVIKEPVDKLNELRKERITTLNELVKSSLALAKAGRGEFTEALEARMMLLRAELEMSEEADRAALHRKALEAVKELEQLSVARKAAAQGTELDVLKAKACRLEIEIALARQK